MVSFQCDACTDVVKKPKLDNHYGQCRSSFTCIDCSSTFAGPVEWKGHTSCITEAEKYQKSVYRGPKKDSRPGNGHQSHTQLKMSTGKYHQSNQSSWSRPQYIRTCASGANTTPLGSPRRMSPVDTSAVKPSPSVANAATKTERGDVKKRDAEKHTPNGTDQKEKKRKKKHDAPREHDGKDAPPLPSPRDETNHEASKVKGSSERHKRRETSGDDTQSKTQFATEGIPETSGDKKRTERKKEENGEKARLQQGDVSNEINTPPEPVAPSVDDGTKDEKKLKKRKHKEKKEDTETHHGSLARETATRLEPLASQTDDAKGEKKKKKKGKEEKAAGTKRKHEDSVANDVKKKRKQREQDLE